MNPHDFLAQATDCFDVNHVRELRDLAEPGEPDFFAELAQLYLQSAPPLLAELASALACADAALAREKAHALKGMSGNLGAFRLHEAAAFLEEKAKKGMETLFPTDLDQVLLAHRRVEEVLRSFFTETS
ncbi:MAG: hypothetical protein OHK005_19220 [Candidatus Methylacidiphilales bacterium]